MSEFPLGKELTIEGVLYGITSKNSNTDLNSTLYTLLEIDGLRVRKYYHDELLKALNPESDMVNNPTHYQHPSGIEVIDITRHESFLRGNVLKYVLRAPYKGNEVEDIKKALKYLTWELERLEKQSDV